MHCTHSHWPLASVFQVLTAVATHAGGERPASLRSEVFLAPQWQDRMPLGWPALHVPQSTSPVEVREGVFHVENASPANTTNKTEQTHLCYCLWHQLPLDFYLQLTLTRQHPAVGRGTGLKRGPCKPVACSRRRAG